MAELLLLGLTHFPRLRLPDDQWANIFVKMLADPQVPDEMRAPESWPEKLRSEWSDDRGVAAAGEQRRGLMADFARMRAELDAFDPDFILMWGDDQYENFKEDGIPPFAVLAYDEIEVNPANPKIGGSVAGTADGGRPLDPILVKGHRTGAKHIASELIGRGFDITYAYQPRHVGLGHAFINPILFMGGGAPLPWPVVPFSVNCYGRIVVAQRGAPRPLSETVDLDFDPPAPPPWRCFDLGAEVARIARESPWRIALIASSSWSHAFFTRKNYFVYPDVEADRVLFEALADGRYDAWRDYSADDIVESGQQEVLNWMCLAGAFSALGKTPRYSNFYDSYIFNSTKVFVAGGAPAAGQAPKAALEASEA
jgi:hypothetical protein